MDSEIRRCVRMQSKLTHVHAQTLALATNVYYLLLTAVSSVSGKFAPMEITHYMEMYMCTEGFAMEQ